MLEQLMEMVREAGQKTVVQNPEVPNEQNEAALHQAQQGIMGGLQNILQTDGISGLTHLFQGVQQGDDSNPRVQQLSNNVAGGLMEKLGLNSSTAKSIAISLIPVVLGKMMNRSKDPNHAGFDLGSILGSLMGGGSSNANAGLGNIGNSQTNGGGGLGSTLSNLGAKFGLDKDGDGDVDMSDLAKLF